MKTRKTKSTTTPTRQRYNPLAEAERLAKAQESLNRATGGTSVMNYAPIYEGFTAKGIPIEEIKPRENVFTFKAWLALGRAVRKGEHGVRVVTFIPMEKTVTDPQTGEVKVEARHRAWTSTVFHISQTDEVRAGSRKEPAVAAPEKPAAPLASFPVQEYRPTLAPAPAPRPEPAPAPAPEPKPTPAAPAPAPTPAVFDWRSAMRRRIAAATAA